METLESYELSEVKIVKNDQVDILTFASASLLIDTCDTYKGWFIDISYLNNRDVLERFAQAVDIKITVTVKTVDGKQLTGEAYFYPNNAVSCAAIKGEGVLFGYEHL